MGRKQNHLKPNWRPAYRYFKTLHTIIQRCPGPYIVLIQAVE